MVLFLGRKSTLGQKWPKSETIIVHNVINTLIEAYFAKIELQTCKYARLHELTHIKMKINTERTNKRHSK
jgi:hypothetical protein